MHSPTHVIIANVREVMTADDVVSVLAVPRNADADVWIGGGWGIDALVGEHTRLHRDLDLMHRDDQEAAVAAALADAGFTETLDRRPVWFVVTGRHRPAHSPAPSPPVGPELPRAQDVERGGASLGEHLDAAVAGVGDNPGQ